MGDIPFPVQAEADNEEGTSRKRTRATTGKRISKKRPVEGGVFEDVGKNEDENGGEDEGRPTRKRARVSTGEEASSRLRSLRPRADGTAKENIRPIKVSMFYYLS